ncbi:MAG TPA: cell division protein ZapA [Firmicutes bacterium]|nr:cell division protein ZapA [Bacillota bacterium]
MSLKREEPTSVRVQILGEEHLIKGRASREYIEELARLIDTKMTETKKTNPMLPRYRVAILVALNIANDLEKLKKEHEELLALLEEAN